MDTYQDFDFPVEILCQPQPMVAFIGLNITSNTVHRNIWEMFTINRHTDRVPMEFLLLPADFVLPVLKPKRASYEWYVPKGILKTNWMTKHLQQIPSVIVLFYELDWDDAHWTEKKLECASQVHSIRTSVEVRNTKIAVVLIQKSAHLINVVTEDSLSTERASELCTACDINPKLLLLLLHNNEHLQGYIVRLESAFHELAQSYYTQQIRNIKMHKDYLNKTSHQYLLVRHQYKIAFFNEMKRDLSVAHKNYLQANASLFELKVSEANLNEIRTVAAFITYKLCKIYFALNQPRDAISQFNTHIDKFRLRTGPQELLFEHYAWLSKQFMVFGNLFEEETRHGLPAVQTRHPGFYYEQAAQYATQRKKLVTINQEPIQYPQNDPLVGWDKVEFYGQRPWRLNNRSEAMEVAREQMAICALRYRERYVVNHSALIINHLGCAISQFKIYRSPRKRIFLAVQMADEYYNCKEYGQALTLFTHMLWEYRNDKWWELTVDLLRKALNCAYLTASLQEYVERSIEASYLFPNEDRLRIMANIDLIIRDECPLPEPALPETDLNMVQEAWSSMMRTNTLSSFNVDMFSVTSFILCKATFIEANCDAVSMEIWLRNEFPKLVTFSKLTIGIASQARSTDFVVVHEDSDEQQWLQMNTGDIKCIPFTFVPSASDIGNEIQLKHVSLTYGSNREKRSINLRFSGVCSESDILEREESHLILSSKKYSNFARLQSRLTIQIQPRLSLLHLSIEHNAPSLNGEWYPMKVTMKNDELTVAKNTILFVTLLPGTSPTAVTLPSPIATDAPVGTVKPFATEIFENIDGPACMIPFSIRIGDILVNEVKTKILYFKTMAVDSKNVAFRVEFQSANVAGEEMLCMSEQTVKLDCADVFEITASFLSPKCEHLSKIYVDQWILMRMQVDCVSPWPIRVKETNFKLSDNFVNWDSNQYKPCLKECVLKNAEIGVEAVAFFMKKPSDENGVTLGSFLIYWERENDKSPESVVCTEVQLPQMKVDELPLIVNMDIESPSWVRTPLPMNLVLRNISQQLMSFETSIEHVDVDAFMFSGCKQMSFNILPGGEQSISYNLFPLYAGYLPLPQIRLTSHSELITQAELNDLMRRTLPTCIFVLPQKKGIVDHTNVPVNFIKS